MQDVTTTTFRGETITVNELTVRQVREVFERLASEEDLFIDDLLDQPVPTLIVSEATGKRLSELEEAKPSELLPLCQEVMRVNPSLASMIKRRIEAVNHLENLLHSEKN